MPDFDGRPLAELPAAARQALWEPGAAHRNENPNDLRKKHVKTIGKTIGN